MKKYVDYNGKKGCFNFIIIIFFLSLSRLHD